MLIIECSKIKILWRQINIDIDNLNIYLKTDSV